MKADKISNAFNYIDDDLIAECDKVRTSPKALVKPVTKAKKKANVTRLWGSIAAAAIVLVIGFFVMNIFKDSSKSEPHRHSGGDKSEEVVNSPQEDVAVRETAAAVGEEFDTDDVESAEVEGVITGPDGDLTPNNGRPSVAPGMDENIFNSDRSLNIVSENYIMIYAGVVNGDFGAIDGDGATELWTMINSATTGNEITGVDVSSYVASYNTESFISLVNSYGSELRIEIASGDNQNVIVVYWDNEVQAVYSIDVEISSDIESKIQEFV